MTLVHSQVPRMIHIPSMRVPPLVKTQRIAAQCGAEMRKGDIKNPYMNGIDNFHPIGFL